MKSYLAGQEVKVVLPLVDADGQSIVATAASYRVLNEEGGVVQGPASLTPWAGSETEATVTVTAGNNGLGAGVMRGLRRVELTLTTATGTKLIEDAYTIEPTEPFTVPTNSFQTYGKALLTGSLMPKMSAWDSSSRADRISALLAARDNLCKLSYKWEALLDPMQYIEPEFVAHRLDLLTNEEYLALPEEFRAALEKAQLVEANHLLTDIGTGTVAGQTAKMREAGLFSMTTGESSNMFRPGKPMRHAVCEDALRVIGRYVNYSKRLGRS
jgi:hypothetical protein